MNKDAYNKITYDWLNDGGWLLFSHSGVNGEFLEENYSERDMDKGLVVLAMKQPGP